MNLEEQLRKRIHLQDIKEIISNIKDEKDLEYLFSFALHEDDSVRYQTLWVLTHLKNDQKKWLQQKQEILIDSALKEKHDGSTRLWLTLLEQQDLRGCESVSLLNFCLESIVSPNLAVAIRSVAIKIAFELSKSYTELLDELKTTLHLLENEDLAPSVKHSYKKILREIEKASKK